MVVARDIDGFKSWHPVMRFAAFAFVYGMVVFYLSQVWILPLVEPSTQNGLIGGDPQLYHELAKHTADAMHGDGISSWEMRPGGQGVAGVGALMYYVFGPSPRAFVVLNAVLHAISATVLWLFAARIAGAKAAKYPAILFLLSPYQAFWFSQPNKESFVVAGTLLYLFSLFMLLRAQSRLQGSSLFIGLLTMLMGIALTGLMRPYLVDIALMASTGGVLIAAAFVLVRVWRTGLPEKGGLAAGLLVILIMNPLLLFANHSVKSAASDETISAWEKAKINDDYPEWSDSELLPKWVNDRLFVMATQRLFYVDVAKSPNPTSRDLMIEWDRRFEGTNDFLTYLPRALQIGFLAPFPGDWGISNPGSGSVFRNVVQFEMLIAYVGLFGIAFALFTRRLTLDLGLPLFTASTIITVYGLAIPHVGALNRYRYACLAFVTCVGLALLIDAIRARGKDRI